LRSLPISTRVRGWDEAARNAALGHCDPTTFGIDPWIARKGLDRDEQRRRVEAWRNLGASHVAVETLDAGLA
jgi:hypothetical protein